jgi:adenylate cyclase
LFGAPVWQEDDAERAVACAVAMQLAMAGINEQNREEDLPEIEMGVGVHTGQVVVGNIGSPERMKYGVVGSHVNLTSRVQSYTVGGQILISDATRQDVGKILRLGKQTEVKAKGIEHPITLYEVLGVGGRHKLQLADTDGTFTSLADAIEMQYEVLDTGQADGKAAKGSLVRVSRKGAEARLETPVPSLCNLKMRLFVNGGQAIPGTLYGKVLGTIAEQGVDVAIRFTSVPPEIDILLVSLTADGL